MSGPAPRVSTFTRTLPYHSSTYFRAITEASAYHTFLSQVITSTVVSKDAQGLPKVVKLKVGYPPIGVEEEWRCTMKFDRSAGTAELRCNTEGGAIETVVVKWKITPAPSATKAAKTTTAELTLELKFSGMLYDQMFALLPSSVPEKLMESFEERTEVLDGIERKERVAQMKEKAKAAAAKKEGAKGVGSGTKETTKKAEPVKSAVPAKVPAKVVDPAKKVAPKKTEVRPGKAAGT
ncbi:Coenzyme Q-binding protein coq10, mitochondrial [Recurvomyces mirabilis]|uniref:Coenzyme Q-binding protein coq10, mitochondrial n=1 Tax=Recurvomyces mirabilis TaxID=574656 RepID=A0AAE0WM72_9PEZI|nr:Coenzyme Q-binding protein coq10, mitochondrial [Recurvomyces mirabilis]KAK5154116.1 Coenzyme Q-binding protein coq10, mitochondrial [Recurvomyces mirabilis]